MDTKDNASKSMTAKLLRHFDRPDGERTGAEGSITLLSEKPIDSAHDVERAHAFVNWVGAGYISEYDGRGRLIMEARFVSVRSSRLVIFEDVSADEPLSYTGPQAHLPSFQILVQRQPTRASRPQNPASTPFSDRRRCRLGLLCKLERRN